MLLLETQVKYKSNKTVRQYKINICLYSTKDRARNYIFWWCLEHIHWHKYYTYSIILNMHVYAYRKALIRSTPLSIESNCGIKYKMLCSIYYIWGTWTKEPLSHVFSFKIVFEILSHASFNFIEIEKIIWNISIKWSGLQITRIWLFF